MDIIYELFSKTNVVSTHEVAVAFDMTESTVRSWAEELEVGKVGVSYAWARPDVEALTEQLDECEKEQSGELDDEDGEEGGDSDEDDDE